VCSKDLRRAEGPLSVKLSVKRRRFKTGVASGHIFTESCPLRTNA